MDANDALTFSGWFDVLAVTHGRAFFDGEIRARAKSAYFDVLRPYPLEAVQSAYEGLRRKMKKWPVPADWLEALPPQGSTWRLQVASPSEITEGEAAAQLGYEAVNVCGCEACRAADCFMSPRYVPQLDRDGHVIERRHPRRQGRAVRLGRWLHGRELMDWYAMRADFYSKKAEIEAASEAERKRPRGPEERLQRLVTMAVVAKAGVKAGE